MVETRGALIGTFYDKVFLHINSILCFYAFLIFTSSFYSFYSLHKKTFGRIIIMSLMLLLNTTPLDVSPSNSQFLVYPVKNMIRIFSRSFEMRPNPMKIPSFS